MVILVALSLACHDIMQQPDKIWRYRFLFLLIVLQAKRAIANTVFTPSINPTRGVIIQPHMALGGLVLGPLILYLKGTRIVMFQISGFYYTVVQYKYIGTRREWYYCSLRTLWVPPVVSE